LPGRWNAEWQGFITQNPGATSNEVFQQAGKMMDEYGLSYFPAQN
jgi:hypothetical protein